MHIFMIPEVLIICNYGKNFPSEGVTVLQHQRFNNKFNVLIIKRHALCIWFVKIICLLVEFFFHKCKKLSYNQSYKEAGNTGSKIDKYVIRYHQNNFLQVGAESTSC